MTPLPILLLTEPCVAAALCCCSRGACPHAGTHAQQDGAGAQGPGQAGVVTATLSAIAVASASHGQCHHHPGRGAAD